MPSSPSKPAAYRGRAPRKRMADHARSTRSQACKRSSTSLTSCQRRVRHPCLPPSADVRRASPAEYAQQCDRAYLNKHSPRLRAHRRVSSSPQRAAVTAATRPAIARRRSTQSTGKRSRRSCTSIRPAVDWPVFASRRRRSIAGQLRAAASHLARQPRAVGIVTGFPRRCASGQSPPRPTARPARCSWPRARGVWASTSR